MQKNYTIKVENTQPFPWSSVFSYAKRLPINATAPLYVTLNYRVFNLLNFVKSDYFASVQSISDGSISSKIHKLAKVSKAGILSPFT